MIKMILCVDKENGLSKNNKLAWDIKEEMKHFSETTKNQIVVMGKNTYLSISKPLVNRRNIVLSKNKEFISKNKDDIEIISDINFILELSKNKDVYIIGGKQIYELFLEYADEIIISRLNESYDCDLFFEEKNLNFFKPYKIIKKELFTIEYLKSYKHKILDGKKCSEDLLKKLIIEKDIIKQKTSLEPKLVIINIGNNFANNIYVNNKLKLSKKLNINTEVLNFDNISEEELIELINNLNNDKSVNGILLQSPVTNNIDFDKVCELIDPLKDVDCFNSNNFGKMFKYKDSLASCTPLGIIKMLEYYNIELESKNVVILGRSNIVGKPLISLLLNKNANVTILHSKTKNIDEYTKKADIIISAVGKKNILSSNNIKQDSILIDVGINRDKNNKVCGDIDFYNCLEKVKYISPVPGGVGPMTLCMLFYNLLELFKKQINFNKGIENEI